MPVDCADTLPAIQAAIPAFDCTSYLLDSPLNEHHVFMGEGPQGSTQGDLIRNDVVGITALQHTQKLAVGNL